MPFTKIVPLSGAPATVTASHWRIARIRHLDAARQEAIVLVDLCWDAGHTLRPAHPEAIRVTIRGAAFDAYFGPAAPLAFNPMKVVEQLLLDATSAKQAAAALKANPQAPSLTPAQMVLSGPGAVDFASDYGDNQALVGAAQV